jgi:hypothetical protein
VRKERCFTHNFFNEYGKRYRRRLAGRDKRLGGFKGPKKQIKREGKCISATNFIENSPLANTQASEKQVFKKIFLLT